MPTNWPEITDRVMVALVVLAVLYDVAAALMGGGPATISARIQHYSGRFPVIPFALGMLAAHFVWPVFGLRD